MIVGCWRRVLVALDKDRVWVILKRSFGMMYGAGYVIYGCLAEAQSRAQRRTAENSGRVIMIGSREAGRNERSNLPP